MKMKKKLCSLLALLCILSLTACGANSKIAADSNTPSAPQDMPTMSADSAPSAGWDAPMSEEGAFLPEPSPDAGYGGVPANAKIIYTATLSLETKEFDAASQALAALVSDVGGYFESRSVDQGHYRSMDAVVRVPAAEFLSFLDRAGETAHVANRAEYLDDVSEAYCSCRFPDCSIFYCKIHLQPSACFVCTYGKNNGRFLSDDPGATDHG